MKDKVIIIGGKGTAVVIAEQIIDAITRYQMDVELLGFAFDDETFGKEINGLPIICKTKDVYEKYKKCKEIKFIFQLYRFDLLKERVSLRDSIGIPIQRFYSFIHPSAYVARSVSMGYGNIILAHCTVNCNTIIGNFNTINSNVLIGHDTIIDNNNFIAGHTCIGSGLKIGNSNFFGLNSSLKNKIHIGNNNIIGMASNVVNNIENNLVLIGNPAKLFIK